jgi:hypothetical protein
VASLRLGVCGKTLTAALVGDCGEGRFGEAVCGRDLSVGQLIEAASQADERAVLFQPPKIDARHAAGVKVPSPGLKALPSIFQATQTGYFRDLLSHTEKWQ